MAKKKTSDIAENLHAAASAVLAVHQLLGPDHQALTAEAGATDARERAGTLQRMRGQITDCCAALATTAEHLATTVGLAALGIDHQYARAADGQPYTPLPALPGIEAALLDSGYAVRAAITHLHAVYQPTRKYPALARPRHPDLIANPVIAAAAAAAVSRTSTRASSAT